jgi:aminopeptidase N
MKSFSILIITSLFFIMACDKKPLNIESGVSLVLAKARKEIISDINYQLTFSIPETVDQEVVGSAKISFTLLDKDNDLILDFNAEPEQVKSTITNTGIKKHTFKNGHIVIPKKSLQKGQNTIEIEFVAGNNALNRSKEFLYTLFVPDRASTVFPCFDQPDLKATYDLTLNIPSNWIAVSNGKVAEIDNKTDYKTYKFEKSPLISSYLFAFTAGKFKKLTRTKNGRTLNFYHRETDKEKIALNADEIFNLHFIAIDWMEEYTGIPYPFKKLEFVAIPSFQFAGMEHVDAIFYRESKMFLSKSATLEDKMVRASTITHETSHMWFGDLVTMKWFDDVWLKEVFANFLAAKMVEPIFPEINQNLNFINTHFPRAYLIDRTEGSNPIKQKLDNLKYAGTLYGKIIYDKAPIIMVKLERLISKDSLQEGLKEYLTRYEYGNASWEDLIGILDKRTTVDLNDWSKTWVEQSGMPHISCNYTLAGNRIKSFTLLQDDSHKKNRIWKQNMEVLYSKNGKTKRYPLFLDSKEKQIEELKQLEKPDYILLNGDGYGYGYFELDSMSQNFLSANVCDIQDPEIRAISYITLYQALLNFRLKPQKFIETVSCALRKEKEKQNIPLLLNYLRKTWWYFLAKEARAGISQQIETELFSLIKNENDKEIKSLIYQTLSSIFISKESTDRLYNLWKTQKPINGLKLSKNDYTVLAYELIVRDHPEHQFIETEQLARISKEEPKQKMKFVLPAVSVDEAVRDKFFASLKDYKNRQHEIWVRTALYYLNHPLRENTSIKYLKPSLEMLGEIQKTGDIFFPKNWLVYTVGRYNSAEAVEIVNDFINENPDYNKNLKAKILQFSDMLFRAQKIDRH